MHKSLFVISSEILCLFDQKYFIVQQYLKCTINSNSRSQHRIMLGTHTLHHLQLHHHRGSALTQDLEKVTNLNTLIVDINSHIALFRDMLIHIGQSSKDSPELREKIRKLRRTCVDACKHTAQLLMPQVKSAHADGHIADNPHLVLLYYLIQLFLRELIKSYRLIQVIPMDMSGYYENRAGPSNLGNVISQILLCKQITPDFNQEELCSITKDSQELAGILKEMQEFMPEHETFLERNAAAEGHGSWPIKRRRNSFYKNMSLFCCVSRPNYL